MNEGMNKVIVYLILVFVFGCGIWYLTKDIGNSPALKEREHLMPDGEVMEGSEKDMKMSSTTNQN